MTYEFLSLVLMVIPLAVVLVAHMIRENNEFAKVVNDYNDMKLRAIELNNRMDQDLKEMNALLKKHSS